MGREEEQRYYKCLFPDPCSLWLVCFKCDVNNQSVLNIFHLNYYLEVKFGMRNQVKQGSKYVFQSL